MRKTGVRCSILILLCFIALPGVAKGGSESAQAEASDGEVAAEPDDAAGGEAHRVEELVTLDSGLSVEHAMQAVLENSVEIDLAQLDLRRCAAAAKEARAAKWPTVKLQTSGSAMSNPPEGFAIPKGAFGSLPTPQSYTPVAFPAQNVVLFEDAEHTYFNINATLTQPLFTWGKLDKAVTIAELDCDIAGEKYLSKEQSVKQQVRLAYFGTVYADNTKQILEEAESIAGDILKDKETAYSEGVITRQTVLDAAAKKAMLTAYLAQASEAGKTARLSLSKLTGIELEDIDLISDYRTAPLTARESELVTSAFQASGERGVLLHNIEKAAAFLEIEKGYRPLLPDLALNLSVDITGQKVPVLGSNWTDSWDTNVIITVGTQTTLLDSGVSQSRVEQAQTTVESAKQGLRGYDLNLEIQVRTLVEEAKTAWFDLSRTAAELDLAKEIARNAGVSFENELITRAEILEAQLAVLAAELAHELALFTYETALIGLELLVSKTLVPADN